jgi:hypothetical protein
MRFQWEWVRACDPEGAEWVAAHAKPTLPKGEWRLGPLQAAAREMAECVQGELHRQRGPFDRLDALLLNSARHLYLLALYELGGGVWKLAKDVESEVSPDRQAHAICLGTSGGTDSADRPFTGPNTVVRGITPWGGRVSVKLGAYGGCLHTFPDAPYKRGRKWPRWCRTCARGKTNARLKAIRELEERIRQAP